mgnify:CR=1 FL=1
MLEPVDRALGLLGGIVGDPDSSALAAAAEALEAAEVTAPDLAGSLALFAAVMFYGVVVGSILLMQNMIMGIFRGVPVDEDMAVPAGPTPVRHTLTAGSTSIRRLLSAGVGVDTEIVVDDDEELMGTLDGLFPPRDVRCHNYASWI